MQEDDLTWQEILKWVGSVKKKVCSNQFHRFEMLPTPQITR